MNYLAVLIGFTCLLLAVFLLLNNSPRRLANRLFAVFLVLTAIDVSGFLVADLPFLQREWLQALRTLLNLAQMPFFYGFIAASCFSGMVLRRQHLWHLMPLLLASMLALPGDQLKLASVQPTQAIALLTDAEYLTLTWLIHVQYYLYILASFLLLIKFRSLSRQHGFGGGSVTLRWLFQLLIVSLVSHTLVVLKVLALFSNQSAWFSALQAIIAMLALAITTWFVLMALLQPKAFSQMDKDLVRIAHKAKHTDVQASDVVNLLSSHMDSEMPYLDEDMHLKKLARQMQLSPSEISRAINQELGMSFFEYINSHRIARAKTLLQQYPEMTVLDVLYSVGFNSKSSFNAAFRKFQGCTPTDYRKKHPPLDNDSNAEKRP